MASAAGGAKQSVRDHITGAKAAVVPGILAGTVAGNLSSGKKIEKSASAKTILEKARKVGTNLSNKASVASKRFNRATGGDPIRGISMAQGASIGGTSAYIGQKKMQEDRRIKRKAK